jgi:hypothetical protein
MRGSYPGVVAGLVLVVLGLAWVLHEADVVDVSASVVLAALVVVVGLAVMAAPKGAGRGGLIALGILLALLALAASAVSPSLLDEGVGDRRHDPRSTDELRTYELGIGELEVDLRSLELPARVEAAIGIGQLDVIVPAGAKLDVDADLGAGEIDVRGEKDSGWSVEVDVAGDDADLELDLEGGIGQIRVGGPELAGRD